MSTPRVLIVGAGIGGLTAAIALRAKGIDVEICEAAPAPRVTGTGLGMASNATKVLRALGVGLGERGSGQAVERLEFRTARGRLIRAVPIQQITAQLGHPLVCIHRNRLTELLMDAAGDTPIHYGAQVTAIQTAAGGVRAICADGTNLCADVLIGADGIHSMVRATACGESAPTEHGYVCWLGTVGFSHPRMSRGYVGHYWGRGQRFGLIDIGDGAAYWWGTRNMSDALARDWRGGKAEIRAAFDGWAPEVLDIINRTPDDAVVAVPAQDRPFLERWGRGPVTLLGDAAHPMLTSLGQGASCAVEDAYVLAEALARISDPIAALRTYEDRRGQRARALVHGSRRLSKLEQANSRAVVAVRNLGMRWTPASMLTRQNVRLMQFDLAWSPS